MKTEMTINWEKGMAFSTELNGHKITLDAGEQAGGQNKGVRPKPLMLVALAGCTGMDVVSILGKMRVELKDFKVTTDANMTEEHPKHYDAITIRYEFWGDNLPKDKLEKAVNLSEERYCGVMHVYKQTMKINTEIIVHQA